MKFSSFRTSDDNSVSSPSQQQTEFDKATDDSQQSYSSASEITQPVKFEASSEYSIRYVIRVIFSEWSATSKSPAHSSTSCLKAPADLPVCPLITRSHELKNFSLFSLGYLCQVDSFVRHLVQVMFSVDLYLRISPQNWLVGGSSLSLSLRRVRRRRRGEL